MDENQQNNLIDVPSAVNFDGTDNNQVEPAKANGQAAPTGNNKVDPTKANGQAAPTGNNLVEASGNNQLATSTDAQLVATDVSRQDCLSTSQSQTDSDSGSTAPVGNAENSVLQQQSLQTATNVDQILDELSAEPTPAKQRVWEIDFFRGFLIFFVIWDHLMFDIKEIGGAYNTGFFQWLYNLSVDYYGGSLREACHDAFVTLFIFLSGVSCSFSKNSGKRAIKMIIFALLVTACTYSATKLFHFTLTIYFNVIHVIALSILLWTLIEWIQKKCTKPWQKNVFGAAMVVIIVTSLVVGATALVEPWKDSNNIWFFLAQHNYYVNSDFYAYCQVDYWPFLPDFGWFLIGAFLGQIVYKTKKTLFPSVNPKYVSFVTFCGRHSIWIYFGSQAVMYALIYLLHAVLNWL